jgi:hypothetical protein
MLLAEVETHLSRPIAPTRRVALGRLDLPTDPAPGFGGILLGGIAARFGPDLPEDFHDEVLHLMYELEHGGRIAQPRLRHRLQQDKVGLQRCVHRLVGHGEQLSFEFDVAKGTAAQHVLCAAYAAGTVAPARRAAVMDTVRKGFRWRGEVGMRLVAHLSGQSAATTLDSYVDPVGWALRLLELHGNASSVPSRRDIQRAFREQLRAAHPDHGATDAGAADRIAELSEARRILLG